ncbi:MAG: hypothetical protein AABX10_00205 [Nanoarchaeota archaeon]
MGKLVIGIIVIAIILIGFIFFNNEVGLSPNVKCVKNSPSVVFTSASTRTGTPGSIVPYTLTVINNNRGCGVVQFNPFDVNPGVNWVSRFVPLNITNSTSFQLCDGCNRQIIYQLTSPVSAQSGNYPFIVIVAESIQAQGGIAWGSYDIL